MITRDPKTWRDGYGSLVEAALAHGFGRRRTIIAHVMGEIIEVDFSSREPRSLLLDDGARPSPGAAFSRRS